MIRGFEKLYEMQLTSVARFELVADFFKYVKSLIKILFIMLLTHDRQISEALA